MEFNKNCFFIMSGVSNELGKILTVELCKKFKSGSVVVLFDDSQSDLARTKAAICSLKNQMKVFCCNIDWTMGRTELFQHHLGDVMSGFRKEDFDMAFIIHNEGSIATNLVTEPINTDLWLHHVQISLNSTVALNQTFLNMFKGSNKVVVNLTPSGRIVPFQFEKLQCSATKARDMYFRAMAASEDDVNVLNYRPGFLKTFEDIDQYDTNYNINEISLGKRESKGKNLHVKPLDTINKLIDTLECLKFSSGHDIEYNA